eukprot:TRINITY_DN114284_c0_g1_i1.p1 TRINITY_DN114284_c0_g1~~TRINITY_DN114284_c0_g1_i1.p1  ORF type:complete len:480 (-),score=103.44 TRINITY_DN114284_c0_g1_i1:333-1772(-)
MSEFPPITIPGVQMQKEDSDSDEEAVAARQERRKAQAFREAREEAAQKEAELRRAEQKEIEVNQERHFQQVCAKEESPQVLECLTSGRPDSFEERLKLARQLKVEAKQVFDEAKDVQQAMKCWKAAVHCLDFTARQLEERSNDERAEVYDLLLPLLSNVAIGGRKSKDPAAAIRAANAGLEVARQLPYETSKGKAWRVKFSLARALARGDQRDFEGAGKDAEHVLLMSPGHEEAELVRFNSQTALRHAKRWKGPLDRKRPEKPRAAHSAFGWQTFVCVGLVGGVFAYLARRPAAEADPSGIEAWNEHPVCTTECGAADVDGIPLQKELTESRCARCAWSRRALVSDSCDEGEPLAFQLKTNGTCRLHGCEALESPAACAEAGESLAVQAELVQQAFLAEYIDRLVGKVNRPGCRLRRRARGLSLTFSDTPETDALPAREDDAILCSCPRPSVLAVGIFQKACCTLHRCIREVRPGPLPV